MLRVVAAVLLGGAVVLAACGIDAVGVLEGAGASSSGGTGGGSSSGVPEDGAIGDASIDVTSDGPVVPPDPPLPLDGQAACGRPSV